MVIPVCALALGLFLLQPRTGAADPGGDVTSLEQSAGAAGMWPPFHQNLSRSEDQDSGGADVDADEGRIAVVWAEGTSAQGMNDGRVMLAWRTAAGGEWRSRVVPQQIDGFAHYQPAVDLRGQVAHIVWARKDIQGAGIGNSRISYAQCRLDTGACTPPVAVSPEGAAFLRLAPDIAVDTSGIPHVVWVRQNHQQIGVIFYNNFYGDTWDNPVDISGGGTECLYTQHNPAITLDSWRVYVVWDENVDACAAESTAGIYFRQRTRVAVPSGEGIWIPSGDPWGKQISSAPPDAEGGPDTVDGFPTLDVGEGYVYVMWERLAYSQTLPFYGAVYTYSLPYRVYTGTVPSTDWWPGGAATDRWAALPFTSTSATDTADFYEGLRPSLKMVGSVPHVVWHHWDFTMPAQLEPQDELPDEHLVDDMNPYRVSYATYRRWTDPRNLPNAQHRWISETLHVMESDQILASPDLALSSLDGTTYQLHVALHRRGGYVPSERSFGWDVWYTNNVIYDRDYLPLVENTSP